MKIKRIVTVVIIVVAITVVALIGALFAFLMKQYSDAYVKIDFVERTGTYVMPEYPEVEYDSGAETADDTVDVTLDESYDTEPVDTAALTTEDVVAETQAESGKLPAETQKTTVETPKPTTTSSSTVKKDTNIYGGVPIEKVEQKDKNILNILLIGPDKRFTTGSRGRSDTMIVVSYNKKTGEVKLVSFLRDSLVPINGYGWNRLNVAYASGGIGLSINTINKLFDLDIQYFAVVDMNGLINFVDRIGGVEVTLTEKEAEYYNNYCQCNVTPGVCLLEGRSLRVHVTNRTLDSDFGRTRRQRDVINAVVDKIMNQMNLAEILDLVEYGSGLVKTNIDLMTMLSLATSVVSKKDTLSIESQTVPFSDSYKYAYYNKMAIISFDIDAAAKRINEFLYN